MKEKKENLTCSFCGRDKKETNILIAGINGHICDRCIIQANGIVSEELEEAKTANGDFGLKLVKPTEIKTFLDQYIIGQDDAKKVLADPSQSMVADLPCPLGDKAPPSYPQLNWRHRVILFSFVSTIAVVAYGIRMHGWYLYELSACFIAWGLFTTVIGRVSADNAAQKFIDGAMELTTTAMLIGVARGISLVMEDGQILHTLVHGLSVPLSYVGAEIAVVGMLLIQTFLNFFIPSGSGQAYVTMPLMVPLSDLLQIPRQVAVLAYQFGDGFSNMIIPTNAVLMGIIGIAGVPFGHWFRFCLPLMIKLLIASSIVLVGAVWLGYGLDVQPVITAVSATGS